MKLILLACSFVLVFNTLTAQVANKIISDSVERAGALSELDAKQLGVLIGNNRLIRGRILDPQNNPIPFSTVALKGTSFGAVTDQNGKFLIRVPDNHSDTLVFSHISFKKQQLSAQSIEDTVVVHLELANIELPEIIVSSKKSSALNILNEAIDRIPDNYYQGPISMTIFQRSIQVDSVNSSISKIEWIGNSYFPDGYSKKGDNPFEVLNARKGNFDEQTGSFNYDSYKTSWRDFLGIYVLDQVKFRKNSFLNKRNHKNFTFELADVIGDPQNMTIKIDFVCNQISSNTATYLVHRANHYKGSILINANDYAIIRTESEIVWVVADQMKTKVRGIDKDLTTMVLRVSSEYAKVGDYYYMSKASKYENYNEYGFRNFYYLNPQNGEMEGFENQYETKRTKYDPEYWDNYISEIE